MGLSLAPTAGDASSSGSSGAGSSSSGGGSSSSSSGGTSSGSGSSVILTVQVTQPISGLDLLSAQQSAFQVTFRSSVVRVVGLAGRQASPLRHSF